MGEWILISALGLGGLVLAIGWPVWALVTIVALQLMPNLGIVERLSALHLVAAYGVVVALRLFIRPPPGRISPSALRWLVLVFASFGLLSVVWATNPTTALVAALFKHGKAIGFAWLVSLFLRRRVELLGMLYVIVAIGVLGTLMTLYGVIVLGVHEAEGAVGLQTNSNGNAFFFLLILPLAYALMRGAEGKLLRMALMASLPLFTVGILATGSRSAMLAAGVLWILLLLRDGKSLALYGAVLLGVLGLALALPYMQENVEHLKNLKQLSQKRVEERSLAGRKSLLEKGIAAFLDRPLVGYGLENGEIAVTERMYGRALTRSDTARMQAATGSQWWDLHDTFLTVAVDLGIIGLGLFLAICLVAVRSAANIMRIEAVVADPYMFALGRYLPAGMVAVFLMLLFATQHHSALLWVLLFIPAVVRNVLANAAAERTVEVPITPRAGWLRTAG
jgi:O-antigen ligase